MPQRAPLHAIGPINQGELTLRYQVAWIEHTDAGPKIVFRERREMRPSPLTKIAEQLPAKLPVVPLPQ